MKSDKTIEKEIREITTRLFAYGIDWTEFKDKSPDDHEVSTYAAKIKQEFADTVASEIMQAINAHALTVADRLIGKDEKPLSSQDTDRDSECLNCGYFLEWEGEPIKCRCGDRNALRAELRTAFRKEYGGEE